MKETKKRRQSVILDLPVEDFDEEYEVLLLDETRFRPQRTSHVIRHDLRKRTSEEIHVVRSTVPADVLAKLDEAEKNDSKLGTSWCTV